jgi:hypothetical protein
MNLGTQKPGNTTRCFPVCCALHPDKVISFHMMGDVVPAGKLPHPMLRVDGTAKGLRCFCSHDYKHFLSSKMWVPDWELYGTGQKCNPS